ncbi:MAG: SRPBCC domain-containing protein [Actinomycetota bacterium]|nr:SRPBCC domain-containing protein [Actinomycetota bacterium]
MTVIDVHKDHDTHSMTITAEFDASVADVWQLWADPRLLERWWGPPTYPATFVDHHLTPDGSVTYFMTGPEGDQHHGWWRVTAVAAPHSLEFDDGFADDAGTPNPDMPVTTTKVSLTGHPDGGTRMLITSRFPSLAAMEQLVAMGMEEGLVAAMGQMDALLAA